MNWRVVITDSIFPSVEVERRILEQIGASVALYNPEIHDDLESLCLDADGIITCYAKLPESLLTKLGRCRVIARYGIGVDNIDVQAATRLGIAVTNVPDYCIDEVADHALALILALTRKTVQYNDSVRAGRWNYQYAGPIRRLSTLIVGLVGFGKTGRALAERLGPLGVQLRVFDPNVTPDLIHTYGAQSSSFDELVESSDVVSLHMPLTADTYHLFDSNVFKRMKPGALLVNVSRGGLIDEQALVDALNDQLAGAALDVLEQEGEPITSPLVGHPKVLLTPHAAFYSEEAVEEQQIKAATQVKKILAGEQPDYLVNPNYIAARR